MVQNNGFKKIMISFFIRILGILFMCVSRKFCQRGSNFENIFFLVDEGREDPNTTIRRPLLAHHRNTVNGISLVCRWWPYFVALRFFRGSQPILLEKPIFLRFFRGGVGSGHPVPHPTPSGSAHVNILLMAILTNHQNGAGLFKSFLSWKTELIDLQTQAAY